jgi:NAD(P)-dependent dehydrogenase (short-subunit alcohol dehydrogenase family)
MKSPVHAGSGGSCRRTADRKACLRQLWDNIAFKAGGGIRRSWEIGEVNMSTILLTGANRGIGLELAKQLAAQDHKVLACCRDVSRAAELHGLCEDRDVSLHALSVDSDESVAALASEVDGMPIDVLINNAGTSGPEREQQSAFAMDFDGWAEVMNVNTFGPVRVMHALLPNLRAAKPAKVVNITSQMGALSLDMTVAYAYCTSKAALNKYMKMAAREYRDEDIYISLIHPGWVQTDMGGASAEITPAESAEGIIRTIDRLDINTTGSFWKWNGESHDW